MVKSELMQQTTTKITELKNLPVEPGLLVCQTDPPYNKHFQLWWGTNFEFWQTVGHQAGVRRLQLNEDGAALIN